MSCSPPPPSTIPKNYNVQQLAKAVLQAGSIGFASWGPLWWREIRDGGDPTIQTHPGAWEKGLPNKVSFNFTAISHQKSLSTWNKMEFLNFVSDPPPPSQKKSCKNPSHLTLQKGMQCILFIGWGLFILWILWPSVPLKERDQDGKFHFKKTRATSPNMLRTCDIQWGFFSLEHSKIGNWKN